MKCSEDFSAKFQISRSIWSDYSKCICLFAGGYVHLSWHRMVFGAAFCAAPCLEVTLWQNLYSDIQEIRIPISLSQCCHLYFLSFLSICFDFASH